VYPRLVFNLRSYIGLRETTLIAPLGGVLAAIFLWSSPVRRMKAIEQAEGGAASSRA